MDMRRIFTGQRSRRTGRRPRALRTVERLEERCLLATIQEFGGVASGSAPFDIVKGPDGNLWFTEMVANQIGRITPGGRVTEFSAGITPGSSPVGIAAGPDGNLWFTEFAGNRI